VFRRPENSYQTDFNVLSVDQFTGDIASPIGNIWKLIPDNSKVLDIGAGNGMLGWILVNGGKKNIIIDGIEPSEVGAALARQFYRDFYCDYFEKVKEKLDLGSYDYVVMADVVEHLSDPLGFMQNLVSELSNLCKVVLTVPNVAHGSIRLALLNGDFKYVDSGLLERTHLRFFTLQTIEELVSNLQMEMKAIYYLKRPFKFSVFKLKMIKTGIISTILLYFNNLANTYQFLIVLSHNSTGVKEIHHCQNPPERILSLIKKRIISILKKIFR
jgi:2-polyprenyl-3-methyl-5-hydroxy-6-metoxy-1,4-benzoquinol methylase